MAPFSSQTSANAGNDAESESDVLVDILPSFEFYYNLHRNIPSLPAGNDFYEHPPAYQASLHDSVSENTCVSSVSQANEPRIANSAAIEGSTIRPGTDPPGFLPIEKLYTLPNIKEPVSVKIHVTKQSSKFNKQPEFENMLKEHTSGDVIHGYVIIENKSDKPIKFDMFYLTMEGVVTRYERNGGVITKYNKRFLRMVELSASWCYVVEDITSGDFLCSVHDQYDDTHYGLTNDKILCPRKARKKFFTFKVPSQLLDDTCPQSHFSHKLLPPSFGIDRYENNGIYRDLEVQPSLGYYRHSTRGFPLLTSDLSEDVSITYAIVGNIVGRSKDGQHCILSQGKYHLRIIPFGFGLNLASMCEASQTLAAFEKSVLSRLQVMDVFFSKLEKGAPLTREDLEDLADDDHRQQRSKSSYVSELGLHRETEKTKLIDSDEQDLVETGLAYTLKGATGLESTLNLLTGRPENKREKNGVLNVKVINPKAALDYYAPDLIRARNSFAQKPKVLQENLKQMKESILMEEKGSLTTIKFVLTCSESKSGEQHAPPQLKNVTAELISITKKTQGCHSVPVSPTLLLDHIKFKNLTGNYKKIRDKVLDYLQKFAAEEENFKNIFYDETGLELSIDRIIPKSMVEEVSRLASIEVDIKNVKDYLKVVNLGQIRKQPWSKVTSHEFKNIGEIKLAISNPQKFTVVPTFETCLCSRYYFIRMCFIFDRSVGECTVDVPVQIRNLFNI
ncbi:uncharacterized protein ZBIST_2632 [Zygosaccharomyces bailii]|nr:uncharacterized protein ZBIST_2632 [Zygosaccharomyces bailii]